MTEFMSDFMDVDEKPEHVLHVGDVCVITRAPYSTEHATWLQTGDKVEVIEIYPHIIRVKRIRPYDNPIARNRYMTQSYPKNSWWLNMRKVGV